MKFFWGVVALFGLGLAMLGASISPPDYSSNEVIVWVNDRPITRAQLDYAEKRLSRNDSLDLTDAQRDSITELLIDEELLLQRAESLGIVESDPGVRKAVAQATIKEIVDEFLALPIDQAVLAQFYSQHKAVFEQPSRVAVSALRFNSLATANTAYSNIKNGVSWNAVTASQTANVIRHLPSSPLSAQVLRRYLGPSLADIALTMNTAEISPPLKSAGNFYLLKVNLVTGTTVPELQEIESIVRNEYLSRGREQALADKLRLLWQASNIQFNSLVAADLSVSEQHYSMLSIASKTKQSRDMP